MKKLFTSILAALLFFAAKAQLTPYYTNADANNQVFKQSLAKGPAAINLINNQVNGVINIKINNPYSAKYEIALYSTAGRKITSVLYDHPAGVSIKTMYIPAGVKGMCYVVVLGQGEKHSIKVFVQ